MARAMFFGVGSVCQFKIQMKSIKDQLQSQGWKIVERGPSLSELQLITIVDCLVRERIKDFSTLSKVAEQISKALEFTLGRGSWQVVFLNSKVFARKFVCSGKYYIIFKRIDDLMVFIWLNRIKGVNYG